MRSVRKGSDETRDARARARERKRESERVRGARTRRVRADALLSCGNVPILVKCTVSTWLRDNEDRGCRDLYALRHCVAVDECNYVPCCMLRTTIRLL